MTLLVTWNVNEPETETFRSQEKEAIAQQLSKLGVSFDQWATKELPEDADQEAVLAAYEAEVEELKKEHNFVTVDVAKLKNTGQPNFAETAAGAREKFLDEHTHSDDEVRFFVDGRGTFYLHLEDTVHAIVCEGGDLVSVPKGATHWFDMGTENPDFTAIRFFHDGEGWVGDFTEEKLEGEPISTKFATHDALVASMS
ncbi:1,2-dihydroxy-3-keto-5-methylthiopentene dioxygenase [Corynebacterium lubricantis]|uniref:1,2-dihydroxy-3-keto-5-methylthiopentene dioxygenase n=1 Tax=Corynebacterium lubricantis TaxID=541095 RepID=UPI00035C4CC0|nr:hypothetical protein [Corynebacterium lubricantis]